jgi:hypothetical protein
MLQLALDAALDRDFLIPGHLAATETAMLVVLMLLEFRVRILLLDLRLVPVQSSFLCTQGHFFSR